MSAIYSTIIMVLVAVTTGLPTRTQDAHLLELQTTVADLATAAVDLKLRVKDAFDHYCKTKETFIPSFQFPSCEQFAEDMAQEPFFNLPDQVDHSITENDNIDLTLKTFFTTAYKTMTRFHYVMVNVTTLEKLTLVRPGTDNIPKCTEASEHQFLCHMDNVLRRVSAVRKHLKYAVSKLGYKVEDVSSQVGSVTSMSKMSQSYKMAYNMAALHRLYEQVTGFHAETLHTHTHISSAL